MTVFDNEPVDNKSSKIEHERRKPSRVLDKLMIQYTSQACTAAKSNLLTSSRFKSLALIGITLNLYRHGGVACHNVRVEYQAWIRQLVIWERSGLLHGTRIRFSSLANISWIGM